MTSKVRFKKNTIYLSSLPPTRNQKKRAVRKFELDYPLIYGVILLATLWIFNT